jgi:glutamate synthase (NADPH/NADH) small chain
LVNGEWMMDQKKLREQENRCIQEQAPTCTAACPVHVDARGLAALIARGEFDQAYALYRKAVPFPNIVSRICDQPCQSVCLRKELGGSIELAALERASVAFGSQDAEIIKALPRKNKKVAIIGAGLSGLTAAYDLARKGWCVELFEAEDRIGGNLWLTAPDVLPRDELVQDLQIIEQLGVVIHLNAPVCRTGGNGHATTITRLSDEFDALLISCGSYTQDVQDLKLDAEGKIEVDPVTFQTSLAKVFAAGDVLRLLTDFPELEWQNSAILSISQGRRAATSIDRFLQNVSLTASRVTEGQDSG